MDIREDSLFKELVQAMENNFGVANEAPISDIEDPGESPEEIKRKNLFDVFDDMSMFLKYAIYDLDDKIQDEQNQDAKFVINDLRVKLLEIKKLYDQKMAEYGNKKV